MRARGRTAAIAAALGLLAAACGTETASTAAASGADSEADAGSEPAAESQDSQAPAVEESQAEPAEAEAEGPAPVADHNFPDLNTVNIATGSTLNLAQELAGGDTPVLLWFFAPH